MPDCQLSFHHGGFSFAFAKYYCVWLFLLLQDTRKAKRNEPCSAERGRLRIKGIVLLTGDVPRALSAREKFGQRKENPRLSGPFLSYTGRGAFFLFGQEPKREMGLDLRS